MQGTREHDCRVWLQSAEALTQKASKELRDKYGGAKALYEHLPPEAVDIIGKKAYKQLLELKAQGLDAISEALMHAHAYTSCFGEADYPARLEAISDAPDVLFAKGKLRRHEKHTVAIVGSRMDSRYGHQQAFKIAKELAEQGITIVSGLARGIDTAAHQGALAGHGRTIAVLGCGIDRMYPQENEKLAEDIIAENGAIITEYPPGAEPLAFRFPARNRLISGLAEAVLLIEGRERSGTMITINHALTQGREVFALPGNVDAPGSAMPLKILREGATMCTCAEDLMLDMGWDDAIFRSITTEQLAYLPTEDQDTVLQCLLQDTKSFEELLSETKLPADTLGAVLTVLEVDGMIEQRSGRQYALLKEYTSPKGR